MAQPRTAEQISQEILDELSSTDYACSSLERLSGGLANHVFRGTLTTPLPDGTKEIAVKHTERTLALLPKFKLSTTRCKIEKACLDTVSGLPPPPSGGAYAIRAPKLYYFNAETKTQIHEYLKDPLCLHDYILKHSSSSQISPVEARPLWFELGRSLGDWLLSFHRWAALPEQVGLREAVKGNEEIRQLKYHLIYDRLVAAADNFPTIFADAKDTLEKIGKLAAEELQRPDLPLVHGDFWTGNILLPDLPPTATDEEQDSTTPIFIVDWEYCQLGVLSTDLGHMVAELYKCWAFRNLEEAKWLMEGLAAGYGCFDDDFAFQTALYAGSVIVSLATMASASMKLIIWGSEEQGQQILRAAKELVLRAWHKDRAWFESSDLACLFGN